MPKNFWCKIFSCGDGRLGVYFEANIPTESSCLIIEMNRDRIVRISSGVKFFTMGDFGAGVIFEVVQMVWIFGNRIVGKS